MQTVKKFNPHSKNSELSDASIRKHFHSKIPTAMLYTHQVAVEFLNKIDVYHN